MESVSLRLYSDINVETQIPLELYQQYSQYNIHFHVILTLSLLVLLFSVSVGYCCPPLTW